MLKSNNKFISCIILVFFLTGCAGQNRIVKDPQGKNISLPSCKDYVTRYANIGLRFDVLNKYRGEIELSTGIETSLKDLGQLYSLQANNLCQNAGIYVTTGEVNQYFCRNERLSNSAEQLTSINGLLESIKDIDDAKSKSEVIRLLITDYYDRFLKRLDSVCSEAPKVKLPNEVFEDIKKNTREAINIQRPFVSIASPSIVNENQQIRVGLLMQNVGRTPAQDFTGKILFINSTLSERPFIIYPFSIGNSMDPGMGISNRYSLKIIIPLQNQTVVSTMYVCFLLKYKGLDPSTEFNEQQFFKWTNGKKGGSFVVNQQETNEIRDYLNKLTSNP
jgi:hypothetical protein